jgi:hypothetical protein
MLASCGARIFFAGDTAYAPFFHDVMACLAMCDHARTGLGSRV